MSDFFGNSGGFNKLQGIGLMLSALNPQSFNSTMGMLEMQQASNRMRREQDQEQAAQTLLSPIGQTLQRGASMDIPARPGAYRPNMTMGANGPMFNPTQEAGVPARPAMDNSALQNLLIRASGGAAKYFATQQAQAAQDRELTGYSPGMQVRDRAGNLKFTVPGAAQKVDLITIKAPDGSTRSYNASTQQDEINRAIDAGAVEVKSPNSVVNVNNTPEGEGRKKMSVMGAEAYGAAQGVAREAKKIDADLDLFQAALPAFKPGIDANVRLRGSQALAAIGIPVSGTAQGELMQRIQRRVELANTPKGQGSITDNERGLIREANNLFGSTPDGAELSIQATRQVNAYDAKVAEIYRQNAARNGGVPNPIEVDNEIANLPPPLDPSLYNKLLGVVSQKEPKDKTPPQTINVDGISGTFSGRFEGGKPVYLDPNGRPFVED
jgi:hypothetical protein